MSHIRPFWIWIATVCAVFVCWLVQQILQHFPCISRIGIWKPSQRNHLEISSHLQR